MIHPRRKIDDTIIKFFQLISDRSFFPVYRLELVLGERRAILHCRNNYSDNWSEVNEPIN